MHVCRVKSSGRGVRNPIRGAKSSTSRAQSSIRRVKSSGSRARSSIRRVKSSGSRARSSIRRAKSSGRRAQSSIRRAKSSASRVQNPIHGVQSSAHRVQSSKFPSKKVPVAEFAPPSVDHKARRASLQAPMTEQKASWCCCKKQHAQSKKPRGWRLERRARGLNGRERGLKCCGRGSGRQRRLSGILTAT